jgi:hypothetical protein
MPRIQNTEHSKKEAARQIYQNNSKTLKGRRARTNVHQALKQNSYQPRLLCPAK